MGERDGVAVVEVVVEVTPFSDGNPQIDAGRWEEAEASTDPLIVPGVEVVDMYDS